MFIFAFVFCSRHAKIRFKREQREPFIRRRSIPISGGGGDPRGREAPPPDFQSTDLLGHTRVPCPQASFRLVNTTRVLFAQYKTFLSRVCSLAFRSLAPSGARPCHRCELDRTRETRRASSRPTGACARALHAQTSPTRSYARRRLAAGEPPLAVCMARTLPETTTQERSEQRAGSHLEFVCSPIRPSHFCVTADRSPAWSRKLNSLLELRRAEQATPAPATKRTHTGHTAQLQQQPPSFPSSHLSRLSHTKP